MPARCRRGWSSLRRPGLGLAGLRFERRLPAVRLPGKKGSPAVALECPRSAPMPAGRQQRNAEDGKPAGNASGCHVLSLPDLTGARRQTLHQARSELEAGFLGRQGARDAQLQRPFEAILARRLSGSGARRSPARCALRSSNSTEPPCGPRSSRRTPSARARELQLRDAQQVLRRPAAAGRSGRAARR